MREFFRLVMGNKDEAIQTGATAVLTLLLISLMGWTLLDWPVPEPKPLTLGYDVTLVKEGIVANQANAMAEATAEYNRWLEERARK